MIKHWSKIDEIGDLQINTATHSNRSFYHSLKYNNDVILLQFPVVSIQKINKNWITFSLSMFEQSLQTFIENRSRKRVPRY